MYATAKNNTRRYNSPRRHNGRKGAAKTPFCKVCFDAKQPASVYQSHYVKDRPGPHGKVVCPLLLNQECNYCHEKGHTPKQCPHIAARNARYAERQQQLKQQARAPDADGFCCAKVHSGRVGVASRTFRKAQKENVVPATRSVFAQLSCSSDSDEEVEVKEDFPTIGNAPAPAKPVTTGWAAVAAAPKPEPVKPQPVMKMPAPAEVKKTEPQQDNSAWSDDEDQDHAKRAAFWLKQSKKYEGKSWADSDWDDSSDDEDDEW